MATIQKPPFKLEHSFTESSSPQADSIPSYPHLPLQPDTVSDYLFATVSVDRLNELRPYLWLTGRPGHIRPLHKQLILQRRIFITEDPALHLVWRGDALYLQPLPPALLSHSFWRTFICPNITKQSTPSGYGPYFAAASGLLASYTALVQYPSDFRIALAHNLLPTSLTWEQWCLLAADVRTAVSSPGFPTEPRWEYGELRLARLNLIYKLTLRGFSYFYVYTEYGAYLGENFRLLLLAFAYCSIVLAAMQIIVAYDTAPVWVIDFSYRFAVLAAGFVFTAACAGGGLLVYLVSWHYVATLRALRKTEPKKTLA